MPPRRRAKVSVLDALEKALSTSLPADDAAATVALARRYATELDEAVVISTRAHKALRKLADCDDVDTELFEQFEALAARIEATHTAALIGPKLLAALEQLNLTPKARSAVVKGGGGDASKSALDELRERREQRTSR